MFGDFVEEEENKNLASGETGVEDNHDEDQEEVSEGYEDGYENENDGEEVSEEDKTPYQILMEDLVEKGVLYADDEKEYDVSEDGIEELLEDTINARLSATFEENQDLALLYDIVQNGGSLQDIVEMYNDVNYEDLDMTDPDTRTQVVIDYYTAKGLSENRISKLIETSLDDGSFDDEVESCLFFLHCISR